MNPATLQIVLILLQDAPELMQAVIADYNLFSGGTLTEAQFVANVKAMNTAWTAAKAKWDTSASVPASTSPVTVAAP